MPTGTPNGAEAVNACHDLLLWMIPQLDKRPRVRRFKQRWWAAGRAMPGAWFAAAAGTTTRTGTPALKADRRCPRSWLPGLLGLALCLLAAPPRAQDGAPALAAPPAAEAGEPACRGRPGQGPEMVVIAAGRLLMGSPDAEPERSSDEGPRHGVAVQLAFALGRCEVRVGEFAAFVTDTGYRTEAERPAADGEAARGCRGWLLEQQTWEQRPGFNWRNPGFVQSPDDPVVCVSWNDARVYAHWLSLRTGQPYRLPTEAEWEFATRAGTGTPFWTGDCIHTDQANYDGNYDYNGCGAKTGVYRQQTVPAGSLPANPWGLHEVAGNAWEWVADCWHHSYQGAPTDGSAWGEAGGGDCARRVVRGGGWNDYPRRLRSAYRYRSDTDGADFNLGFRLARTL